VVVKFDDVQSVSDHACKERRGGRREEMTVSAVSEASSRPGKSIRRTGARAQQRIDAHVRRVDAALARRGVPAVERRGIESLLRQQIVEKLRAGGDGGESDAGDALLDSVLEQLADPEAFADAHAPRRADGRRISFTAVAGAIWAPMFVLMIALSQVQVSVAIGQSPPWWQAALAWVLPPLGWTAPVATTALGLIALGQIRRSGGRVYGVSLALFDALLFGLLLLDWVIFMLCRLVSAAIGGPEWTGALMTSALPTAGAVLIDYFIAARAWAAVRDAAPAERR
jgi:hypothetical protein